MRFKPTKRLNVFIITIALCLVVSIITILHPDNVDTYQNSPVSIIAPSSTSVTSSSFSFLPPTAKTKTLSPMKICKYIIVLQQSPVQPKSQFQRLKAIDETWGSWISDSKTTCMVAIILSCPIPGSNGFIASGRNKIIFQNMDVILLSQDQPCNTDEKISAFRNLAETMLLLSMNYPFAEFFTLANDHSFFIVPNYDGFISSLNNSDTLFYTGNHLSLPRGGEDVHFASGGGGITISNDVVHLTNFVWVLQGKSPYLSRILLNLSAQRGPDDEANSEQSQIANSKMVLRGKSYYKIFEFFQSCKENMRLDLLVTEISSLTIICHQPKQSSTITYTLLTSENQSSWTFTLLKEEMFCFAHDKWSQDNPGIILASCLQKLLKLKFRDSFSDEIYRIPSKNQQETSRDCSSHELIGELFNVYGPVRLLKRDYDEWYFDRKRDVLPNIMDTCRDKEQEYYKYSFGVNLVSFHYVDRYEAAILYKYLAKSSSNFGNVANLLAQWPNTSETIGPYSARLIKQDDARRLWQLLRDLNAKLHTMESNSNKIE